MKNTLKKIFDDIASKNDKNESIKIYSLKKR